MIKTNIKTLDVKQAIQNFFKVGVKKEDIKEVTLSQKGDILFKTLLNSNEYQDFSKGKESDSEEVIYKLFIFVAVAFELGKRKFNKGIEKKIKEKGFLLKSDLTEKVNMDLMVEQSIGYLIDFYEGKVEKGVMDNMFVIFENERYEIEVKSCIV